VTAPNHALTGAVIGLSISNPWLALPLAFLSHFACDAIPHYDPPETDKRRLFSSRRFMYEFLVAGAALCLVLVLLLAAFRPHHWLQAAIGAFLATSPDLFWIPRFIRVLRTGIDTPLHSPFLKFHSWVQWKTGPKLIWLEAVWFVLFGFVVATYL
jgi:hypothetical protein